MGKRARNKGGSRAWHKRFSVRSLNTGPSKIASFMNDKKKSVDITIGSRNRAARVLKDPAMLAYLNGKYPAKFDLEKASVEELIRVAKGSPTSDSGGNPRAQIKLKMMADALETLPELHEVFFVNTRYLKIKCYFNQGEATMIQEVTRGSVLRIYRSITYGNIGIAKTHHTMGRICWINPPAEYTLDAEGNPLPAE